MKLFLTRIWLSLLVLCSYCLASDWPQYLGPGRNAVSSESGIKRLWPEGGPEVLWTVTLGEGYGGAAVSESKVYVLDCIDTQTRKAAWAKNIWTDYSREELPRWGIAQNPLIYGDLVIVASQTRKKGVVAYDNWQCKIPVPNVTEIGDGRIFITGGYRAGSAMIRVEKKSESFSVSEVFKTEEFGTHVHPAILHKGYLYGH